MTNWEDLDIEGKTIKTIEVNDDANRVTITTTDNNNYEMLHHQECCESVDIQTINGKDSDYDKIVSEFAGAIIGKIAEAVDDVSGEHSESATLTTYTINTDKGILTIIWLGESNGYYGEGVSFYKMK